MDGPQNSKRISFAVDMDVRSSSVANGARIKNGYVEKTSSGLKVKKRNGRDAYYGGGINPYPTGSIDKVTQLFEYYSNGGTPNVCRAFAVSSLASNGLRVGIISGAYNAAYSYVDVVFGYPFGGPFITSSCVNTNKFTFVVNQDTGTGWGYPQVVTVSNANVTTITAVTVIQYMQVVDAACFKNTLFLALMDGRIYNSAVGDETTWNSSWYIVGNTYNDSAVRLAVHAGCLLLFKSRSIEVFYYAGNPTGSVLAHQESATLHVGLRNRNEFLNFGGAVYFIGNDSGATFIGRMAPNSLQVERISTDAVEKFLLSYGTSQYSFYIYPHPLPSGRNLIAFFHASGNSVVYDPELGLWYFWVLPPPVFVAPYTLTQSTIVSGETIYASGANVYGWSVNPTATTAVDIDGSTISLQVTTPNIDAETRFKKFQSQAVIDAEVGTGTLTVEFSDDDYSTFVNAGYVNLADTLPFVPRLGSFRRRAFRVTHSDNAPCTIHNMELTIEVGDA